MVRPRKGAANPAPFFDETLAIKEQQSKNELTQAEKEKIIEDYFGCHPRYFVFRGGTTIEIDIYKIAMDNYPFNGLKGGQ